MKTDFIAVLLDERWFDRLSVLLLTLPFWLSGVTKLFDLPGALAEAAHFRLQPVWVIVALTIVVQLGGSALLIWRRVPWLGAGALGVFTAIATLIAHPFWTITDNVARFHERNTFIEHIGMIGGLMVAAELSRRESAR